MSNNLSVWKSVVFLAVSDIFHEKVMFFCTVIGIASVLAPLLVLFGLKFGIITSMTQRLERNPHIRALNPIGQGEFDEGWFNQLSHLNESGFIIPRTRFLSAEVLLVNKEKNQIAYTDLIPTAEHDPLLNDDNAIAQLNKQGDGIILSNRTAEKLKAKVSDEIELEVSRTLDGKKNIQVILVKVIKILPLSLLSGEGAFVSLPLLTAIEDYHSLVPVSKYNWPGTNPEIEHRYYASFRLYAKTINDIERLRDWVQSHGIEVETRMAEVEVVRKLNKNFDLLFFTIAILSILGGLLSIGVAMWGNVERKQRELSLMRLIGYPTSGITMFPLIQAVCIALCACISAILIYMAAEPIMNLIFSSQISEKEVVCLLLPEHFISTIIATLFFSVIASLSSVVKAWRISPVDGIRYE